MKMSAKELRTETRRLLESVERGGEVIITYRGIDRARVVPLADDSAEVAGDHLFGLWRDHEGVAEVGDYVRELRRGRYLGD